MYIKSIDIKNIRSIEHFHWELDKADEDLAGWHVLIGDNGSGKSTILKAVSLALLGSSEAQALRENWDNWLTYSKEKGSISLKIVRNAMFDKVTKNTNWTPNLLFQIEKYTEMSIIAATLVANLGSGWFSVAYGPYRRFPGSNPDAHNTFASRPKFAAHLSVFGEDIALLESRAWLQQLQFKSLENAPEGQILNSIRHFINQDGFLPFQVRLSKVTSEGVFFEDANGAVVPIEQLGDGDRSILSMVFDIIRQMQIAYRTDNLFSDDGTKIIMPGVVLIDEVDAHLHPEWQRTIGYWLTDHFPKIQFIVTTHSPLVCQAAVRGSIWRLPAPGSDEQAHEIKPDSEDWKRLVYGDILEAYSTDLFGEHIDRSPEAQAKLQELGELSIKEMEEPLTPEEEKRLDELMNELPSTPYKDTVSGGYD